MEGTLERSGAFANFAKLAWMSKKWRQSSKLLDPGSFNVHKNAIVLIIAMLGLLRLDIEVLDASIETTESNDCRGLSKDDGDANGVLAMM